MHCIHLKILVECVFHQIWSLIIYFLRKKYKYNLTFDTNTLLHLTQRQNSCCSIRRPGGTRESVAARLPSLLVTIIRLLIMMRMVDEDENADLIWFRMVIMMVDEDENEDQKFNLRNYALCGLSTPKLSNFSRYWNIRWSILTFHGNKF